MAMVAVADILGFSSLIEQEPLSKIVDYYIENFHNHLYSSIPDYLNLPESPTHEQIVLKGLVGHAHFSDTVILYSLEDTSWGHRAVILAALRILAQQLNDPALRFRIGISYGEFYCDPKKNIYVGKALIEAHKLEKKQNWCGAALTEIADTKIIDNDRQLLVSYDVPIKNGKTETHTVINWTCGKHDKIDKDNEWLFRKYIDYRDEAEAKAAEEKLHNTEQFHAEVCKAYNCHGKKLKK
ncbi:MAG: hypothetical protein HQK99_06660 [Nitrospirae bacterium]|nr:hypothetical protein [Nitrospirota bacterium]